MTILSEPLPALAHRLGWDDLCRQCRCNSIDATIEDRFTVDESCNATL